MKIRLSLFCFALAVFASNVAEAQQALSFGDQYGGQPAYQSVSGDLFGGSGGGGSGTAAGGGILGLGGLGTGSAGQPGRVWLQSNIADQGLGYQGTYMTLGAKNRLFEDRFDGRWLVEGQIHHSIEDNGGLFANIGIERIFSVDAANADVSFSAWYDYDGDTQSDFSHNFHQVGASAQVKTPKWDVIGNGYFPVGIQDYSYGDPSGINCFVGNNIVLIPGIDSALEGFDVTWRFRPAPLAIVNGSIDIGGYQYSSGLVNAFGGGRVRMGFQAFRGMIVSAEINHDERFNTTGVLGVGWIFGANGSGFGSEYSRLGRDLESVVRNDHIVRFNQDVRLAIDPATGLAYNVVHVNNNADPAFQDGKAERPFAALVTAQNLSAPGDIIAVNSGDGTDRNMNIGINLQDNQRLYGTGSEMLIPLQGGTFFRLCADGTGNAPTISNTGGFAVVTMANNNEIAGINIDGTGAQFGVFGNGNGGSLRKNTISNAILDGARISNPTGDWSFQENTFQNNGGSGLLVFNPLDPTSNLEFLSNVANGNGGDGITVANYDPTSIVFRNNTTNGNSRHGLLLQNYLNSSGNTVLIEDHVANANLSSGIFVDRGDGNLRILDSNITNNIGSGLTIRNWTTNIPTDEIIVGTSTGGTSNISRNGALGNIEVYLDVPGARSNLTITNQTLSNGVRGVYGRAEGIGTVLNMDIIDNVAINNNINDGIRLLSLNSATINTRIGSTNPADLEQFLGNGGGGGDGIVLIAQGANGQPAARMNAVVENVNINNQFNVVIDPITNILTIIPTAGVNIQSLNNGVVDVVVRNSRIGAPNAVTALGNRDTQNGLLINLDNDGSQLINNIDLDNLTLFSNFGVVLLTGTQTFADFSLTNSTIRPDFAQSTPGVRADNAPFVDGAGSTGVLVQANGQGNLSGSLNQTDHPDTDFGFAFAEVVTDGNMDNLTRVNIANNDIQDFTFEGIDVATFGDAQMLLNLTGNNVSNNGAGIENDMNTNNVYNDPIVGVADPGNLFFFDGVNIDAFDQSTISTRIFGNTFRDNFERGLSLNTFGRATINALVENNVFFGNDRGEDGNNSIPLTANGQTNPNLLDSAIFDFEAVNNEEFYIRSHQTQILLDNTGAAINLLGIVLPAGTLGVFYPTNTGFDIFGNAVAQGSARMNLDMSSNALQLGADLLDFSVAPGDFTLGLDGATNGFVGPIAGITSGAFGPAETLIINEESFFSGLGFTP